MPLLVETFPRLRPFCWLGTSSGLRGSLCWLRLFLGWDPSAGWELCLVWEDPSVDWDFSMVETLLLVATSSGLGGSLCRLRLFLGWDPSAGGELRLVWEDPNVYWDFSLVETLLLVGNFVWFGRIPLLVETVPRLRLFCWLRLFLGWDPSAGWELRLVCEDPSVGWDSSLVLTLLLVGKLVWFGRIPLLVETFPRMRPFCWLGTSSGLGGSLCWLRLFLDWDPPAGWDLSLVETFLLVGNFVWFGRISILIETFPWLRPFCWLGTLSRLGGILCWLRLFLGFDPSAGWKTRLVWKDPSVGWDFS